MAAHSNDRARLVSGIFAVLFGLFLIASDFSLIHEFSDLEPLYPVASVIGGMSVAIGCMQIILRCLDWLVAVALVQFLLGAWFLGESFLTIEQHALGFVSGGLSIVAAISVFISSTKKQNRRREIATPE